MRSPGRRTSVDVVNLATTVAGMPEPIERSLVAKVRGLIWRLIVTTFGSCMRYRVTGLAAEGAYFAILSMPPLIFALAGSIGYFTDQFPEAQVADTRSAVLDLARRALTDGAVRSVIEPTIDDVLSGGRYDVISIGFILALWSGSRAMNVFVDTITIMHGLGGQRGIIRTRALSFSLYVLGLLVGVITIPLVVAGPTLVNRYIPQRIDWLAAFYWPIIIVLCICFLATLYHVSVPVRTRWTFNLPGATFSMVTWIVGSYILRWVLTVTASESSSIYGPLAAPIAVLLWLYIVSLAVLVGAAVNASFDSVFPQNATSRARQELMNSLRGVLSSGSTKETEPKATPQSARKAVPKTVPALNEAQIEEAPS